MRWDVVVGDVLNIHADALVVSANPYLTLSGGVGGAFLLRYGHRMQDWLNTELRQRDVRHVPRGTVLAAPPCGSPYRVVLHAVTVDAQYDSSIEVARSTIEECFRQAAIADARSVTLPALATGYGHLRMCDFGAALATATVPQGLQRVIVVLRDLASAQVVRAALAANGRIIA